MKFYKTKPEAQVMTITPDMAREMLATSPGNRTMRKQYVGMLAAAMKRGEWRVTSQGIGFDNLGRLRDAHHRLAACIQADVPFSSVVVFGLRSDCYEVIDTGLARSYSDRMEVDPHTAEALRLGCAIALKTRKPTIDEMRPILEAGFADTVIALHQFCPTRRRVYSTASMRLAACIVIMAGGDPEFVMTQYQALVREDFQAMTMHSQALVRYLNGSKITGTKKEEILARGLKVFDKHRAGITVAKLSPQEMQSAPEFVRSVLLDSVSSTEERPREFRVMPAALRQVNLNTGAEACPA